MVLGPITDTLRKTSNISPMPLGVVAAEDNTKKANDSNEHGVPQETKGLRPKKLVKILTGKQAARLAMNSAEAEDIDRNGEVVKPCTLCDQRHRICKIKTSLAAGRRTFKCLECFKRKKPCSHNEQESHFREILPFLLEEQQLAAGDPHIRLKREQQERKEQERRDQVARERELHLQAIEMETIRAKDQLQEAEKWVRMVELAKHSPQAMDLVLNWLKSL